MDLFNHGGIVIFLTYLISDVCIRPLMARSSSADVFLLSLPTHAFVPSLPSRIACPRSAPSSWIMHKWLPLPTQKYACNVLGFVLPTKSGGNKDCEWAMGVM